MGQAQTLRTPFPPAAGNEDAHRNARRSAGASAVCDPPNPSLPPSTPTPLSRNYKQRYVEQQTAGMEMCIFSVMESNPCL